MTDLRELAGKATPGPWFSSGVAVTTDFDMGECGLLVADCEARIDEEAHGNVAANADYIAACDPTTVLAMLDELAALRAEVERLREAEKLADLAVDVARLHAMDASGLNYESYEAYIEGCAQAGDDYEKALAAYRALRGSP